MNSITDLNKALFLQLDRLGKENLVGTDLNEEVERSRAVVSVSKQIISSFAVVVSAEKVRQEYRGPMGGKDLLEKLK